MQSTAIEGVGEGAGDGSVGADAGAAGVGFLFFLSFFLCFFLSRRASAIRLGRCWSSSSSAAMKSRESIEEGVGDAGLPDVGSEPGSGMHTCWMDVGSERGIAGAGAADSSMGRVVEDPWGRLCAVG